MSGVKVPEQQLNDSELVAVEKGLSATSGKKIQIGLMQGFLTLPFRPEEWKTITQIQGYDHDPRVGQVVDYTGDTIICKPPPMCPRGTSDDHPAWDYDLPIGTPVLAAVQGKFHTWENKSLYAWVNLGLPKSPGEHDVAAVYGHLFTILVDEGQTIYRGQIIALSGNSGTNWAHLDFSLLYGTPHPSEPDDYIIGIATR